MSPSTLVHDKRLRILGVGIAGLILLGAVVVLATRPVPSTPAGPLKAEDLECTLADLGADFVVNYSYRMVPSAGDLWIEGTNTIFDNTRVKGVGVACAVFTFSTLQDGIK